MKAYTHTREGKPYRDPPLLEQSRALTLYLDSLFRDLPPESPTPSEATVSGVIDALPPPEAPPQPEASAQGAAFEPTPFKCVQIELGGLRLAVPMSSLFGIRRMSGKSVRLPGSPPWVLGMLEGDERVQIVDLAVLLERGDAAGQAPDASRHALIIAEGRWAIACDVAGRTLRVDPALVRWSGGHARQPWLAAIVPGELCTLLDPQALAAWLDRGAPAVE